MSSSMLSKSRHSVSFSRSTWAEIDLAALRRNAANLQSLVGTAASLIAVVKADAYGHGAVPVAHALTKGGAPAKRMLAVASVDEGLELREAGITVPILLLSAILPDQARTVVGAGLTATVFSAELAEALNVAAQAERCVATAHLKIDTGMGRLGIWHEAAPDLYRRLLPLRHLRISGIYTHFACADEPDDAMTTPQLAAFSAVLKACATVAPIPPGVLIHAANSAALLRYPETHGQVVRPGLAIYGVSPFGSGAGMHLGVASELWPVMALRSRITHLKRVPVGATVSYGATWRAPRASLIATVPIGYADGYPRSLSNRARVWIDNTMCAVVGRVTMDQILVDCTEIIPNPCLGASVTLFGPELSVAQVADWAGTIPYEILCGVAHRVPRVYLENGESVAV